MPNACLVRPLGGQRSIRFSFRIRLKYTQLWPVLLLSCLSSTLPSVYRTKVLLYWSSSWAHVLKQFFTSCKVSLCLRVAEFRRDLPSATRLLLYLLASHCRGIQKPVSPAQAFHMWEAPAIGAPTQKKLESFPHTQKDFPLFRKEVSVFQLPVSS